MSVRNPAFGDIEGIIDVDEEFGEVKFTPDSPKYKSSRRIYAGGKCCSTKCKAGFAVLLVLIAAAGAGLYTGVIPGGEHIPLLANSMNSGSSNSNDVNRNTTAPSYAPTAFPTEAPTPLPSITPTEGTNILQRQKSLLL